MVNKERLISNEISSPEDFIKKLFDKTLIWLLEEKKTELVKEFEEQEIRRWETYSSFPNMNVTLGASVEKALLFENRNKIYALVLADRLRSRYQSQRSIGFQFGFIPKSKTKREQFSQISTLENIQSLVNQRGPYTYGSCEFYADSMFRTVGIDCWADNLQHGGYQASRWSREEILTPKGLNTCFSSIKRLEKNAFVGV